MGPSRRKLCNRRNHWLVLVRNTSHCDKPDFEAQKFCLAFFSRFTQSLVRTSSSAGKNLHSDAVSSLVRRQACVQGLMDQAYRLHLSAPTKLHCLEPKAHTAVLGNKQKREWALRITDQTHQARLSSQEIISIRSGNGLLSLQGWMDGAGSLLAVGRSRSRDSMADEAGEMGEVVA